ncbi:MAG TPA: Sec-independent protein translocase protein TatB [Sphingobium sp.]|nr:Sec-independent protein translocase protein TatB [Sphingobium sp.]
MFDIGSSELLLTAIVAIVVIGPKDLPRALYKVGQIMGKARAMTRHFRAGVDEMVRQVELEELEKKWAADNARIMAESGTDAPDPLFLPDTAGDDTVAQAPTADEPKTGTSA